MRTNSLPPATQATRVQSPETATSVTASVPCALPGSDTRLSDLPGPLERNASVTPLVSPTTRFVASERKATHDPRLVKLPSTAGLKEGPLAWPPFGLEISSLSPLRHAVPVLPYFPARRMMKT